MSRPSSSHARATVALAELEPDDVLIFPHADAGGVTSWEVWRIPYVTVPASEVRPGDRMLGKGGAWSAVLEVSDRRLMGKPVRRINLADGHLDWEQPDALVDVRRA